jgi:hypothetical protein
MVGRWAKRAQHPPAMIFSNPSEASMSSSSKRRPLLAMRGRRSSLLLKALLAVEAGGEAHIEGDQHQREQGADGEQPPAGLVDGRLAGRPGTAAFGVVIRATLLPAPLAAVVVGPEPPPDPTVITPFMLWV